MTHFSARIAQVAASGWMGRGRRAIAPLGAATGLATVLGLGGGLWAIQASLTPPVAHAYTTRVSLFVVRRSDEPFEVMIRRAEALARAGAQRAFDADILVSEASVIVVGESQGISVPILTLQVTRPQWRSRPDAAYWATYYRVARELLSPQAMD
jgi:hypothetical protein